MSQEKQGCKRVTCPNNLNGFCNLESPKVVKREAFIDCFDFENPPNE
jgi:hypothetical protein